MSKPALSDAAYPVGTPIYPQQLAIGSSADTGWVALSTTERLQFVIKSGSITSTGVLTYTVWQAQDGNGTGAKLITSKAPTAVSTSNGIVCVNINGSELDLVNSFNNVKVKVQDATAAAYVDVTILSEPATTPPGVTSPVTQVV